MFSSVILTQPRQDWTAMDPYNMTILLTVRALKKKYSSTASLRGMINYDDKIHHCPLWQKKKLNLRNSSWRP